VSHISTKKQKGLEGAVNYTEFEFKISSISPHPVIEYLKEYGGEGVNIGSRLKDGSIASDKWLPELYNPFIESLKQTAAMVVRKADKGYVTREDIEDIVTRDTYPLLRVWKQEWLKDNKFYDGLVSSLQENNRLIAYSVCKDNNIILYDPFKMFQRLNRKMNIAIGLFAAGVVLFASAVIFGYRTYRAEREEMKEDGQRIERMVTHNIETFKKDYNVDNLIESKVLPLFKKEKEMTFEEAEQRLRTLLREEGITKKGQIETIRTAVFEDKRVKGLLKMAERFSGD